MFVYLKNVDFSSDVSILYITYSIEEYYFQKRLYLQI